MGKILGDTYSKKDKDFIALAIKPLRFVIIGGAFILLTGCTLFSNSPIGSLDKNVQAALDNTTDKGYPDLSKVPNAPTNLKSDDEWARLQKFLVANGRTLDANPNTAAAQSPDINWAMRNIDKIEASPYSTIAPAEDIAAWAARMRAIIK